MVAAVIGAIEEALGTLGVSAGEAAAGANAAGQGLNDLEKASGGASNQLKNNFTERLKEAQKTVTSLEEAIKELQGGAKKYEGALGDAGLAATGVAAVMTAMIPGMQAFGIGLLFAGDKLTDLAKASLKQNDLLVKGYQSLSEFGAIDPAGLRGVLDSAKNVGAVPETMAFMLENITRNSQQLAIFGGTVNEGGKVLTRTIDGLLDPSKQFERVLTNLGYTTEDLMKYSSGFIATNSRTIKGMSNDEAALKAQTNQYLETLAELSELTGISRDQQQKAAQELQMEVQWRQYLRELAKEPDGARKVQQANLMMANIVADKGKDMGHVMMDFIVNGGATTAISAQLQGTMGGADRMFKQSVATGSDATVAIHNMSKAMTGGTNAYLDAMGPTLKIAGAAKDVFVTYKMFDNAMYSATDATVKGIKDQTNQIKNEGDARLNEEAKRKQAERVIANVYQELHYYVGNLTVPAIRTFTEMLIAKTRAIGFFAQMAPGFNADKEFARYDLNKTQLEYEKNKGNFEAAKNKPNQDFSKVPLTKEEAKNVLDSILNNPNEVARYRDAQAYGGIERLQKIAGVAIDTANKATENADNSRKLLDNKINIKPGAVTPGTTVDPRLAKIAEDFTKMYPNARLTGYNEAGAHAPGGKHYKNSAMDLALEQGHNYTPAEVKQMTAMLKQLGASVVLDETKKKEGPHLHIEIGDNPAKQVELNNKKVSMTVPTYKPDDTKTASVTDTRPAFNNQQSNNDSIMVVAKLDELRTIFNRSLGVQEEILSYTKQHA
jgi:hypothetical protein